MRQRSRAFIVADVSNPSERVLFINSGTSSIFIFNPSTQHPAK
jgi:hypothetical protein